MLSLIQCTLSGTNFVYIVLVSKEIEAYNYNLTASILLAPE